MNSHKAARSKLADVLADIKNSRAEDEYDYNNQDIGPTPAKRRSAVNYVALSGHTPRQTRSGSSRSNNVNNSTNSISAQTNNSNNSTTFNISTTPQTKDTSPSCTNSSNQAKIRTYILKLFDRQVDLAPYFANDSKKRDDKPLYPVCRAWVHGYQPNKTQSKSPTRGHNRADKSELDSPNASRLDTTTTTLNEIDNEVLSFPPPKSKLAAMQHFNIDTSNEDIDLRIPQSVREFKPAEDIEKTMDESISKPISHEECLEANKRRWRKVRCDWAEVRKVHEYRYEESFKILDDMFMTFQRGS